ncbi:MAG TPA: hypothetical protein VFX76_21100 [Roseiflexaceae bacterium]|nr:hypothetical protein [Roseiflexaceae bacterium]
MQPQQPRWEGLILAFVMIFTVLLGIVYAVAVVFRITVPWLAILLVAAAVTIVLGFRRRR